MNLALSCALRWRLSMRCFDVPSWKQLLACALLALGLLVSGCVRYVAKPVLPGSMRSAFEARRLDAPELGERVFATFPTLGEDWPPAHWDRANLLAVAIVNSADLAIARAGIDGALAEQTVAGAFASPDILLQTEYARREESPWLYGLGIAFPLGSKSRRAIGREIAGTRTMVARNTLLEATWTLRSELASALSAREAARRKSAVLDELVVLQEQRVALFDQRIAIGEDADNDAVPAREALLRSEAEGAEARAEIVRVQGALATLLGVPFDAVASLEIAWADWGEPPAVAAADFGRERERALLARSDLVVAVNDYAIAELDVQRAIAQQVPELVLSPEYLWDHGIVKLPLAVGFTLPRFDRNRAAIAAMLATREVSGQRLLATQARIHGDIDAARAQEAIAIANSEAARRRQTAADQHVGQRALALRVGDIDRGDMLGADILAREAASALVQRLAERQRARLALEDALHAPLSGPELALPPPRDQSGEPR